MSAVRANSIASAMLWQPGAAVEDERSSKGDGGSPRAGFRPWGPTRTTAVSDEGSAGANRSQAGP